MPQVSKVLRSFIRKDGRTGYGWWCPGCKHMHYVPTDGGAHPTWSFDGNLEKPTFNPSFLLFQPFIPAEGDDPAEPKKTICHVFIRAGMIEFLNDCEHELRGFVPMTDLDTITDYGWGYD